MRTHHHLAAILTGTAVVSAIVITLPSAARALPGTQVNDIAREVTVLISGEQGQGSGVIIQRNGNTYFVLTAYHVVSSREGFRLLTADQQPHKIDASKIRRVAGVDLAVVEFTSDKSYSVAKIGTSKTNEGQDVFVSGWPSNGAVGTRAGGELIRQFTSGSISGFLPKALNGYSMIYTNVTRAGMSGCPVLDTAGRVVGIHGMGDTEDAKKMRESGASQEMVTMASKLKSGFNYAVPISVFLKKANSVGISSSALQIDQSPAPEAGAAYTASNQTDPRDKISNLQATLNTLNDIKKTADGVRDGADSIQQGINSIRGLFGR